MMNRTLATVTIPLLMIAGCSSREPELQPATGAKPITVVTPTSTATPTPSVIHTTTSEATDPAPAAPMAVAVDSIPRETDFNNDDVGFVAESVVRGERVVKAAEHYLSRPGISPAGKELAARAMAQQSASLMEQKEILDTWGIRNAETIFPAYPMGIPTEADIDQFGAMSNEQLDKRFLELMTANTDGAAESARKHITKGYNPEVRANAQLLIRDLEKEKAAITAAVPER